MKALLIILRRTGICLTFALLAGAILLFTDQWVCGEVNGKNAAGGGAAIGMLAMGTAALAWLLSFVALTLVDLGRYFGFLKWTLSAKKELLVLIVILVVWSGVAIVIIKDNC